MVDCRCQHAPLDSANKTTSRGQADGPRTVGKEEALALLNAAEGAGESYLRLRSQAPS